MANVREYLRKRAERKEHTTKPKPDGKNYSSLIIKHRVSIIVRTLIILALAVSLAAAMFIQMKNQVYTSYVSVSRTEKVLFENASCLSYGAGFLAYSKDGISYSDSKGNAQWNLTYEMQNPIVRTNKNHAAVGDYNGHIIYGLDLNGKTTEIDTNLPIREIALSGNGMIAAVVEDSGVTWVKLYDASGTKISDAKTSMQDSGYPIALALSNSGNIMAISYLFMDSGTMRTSVAFYNFGSVGKNVVNNFVSGNDYADSVMPQIVFMNDDTCFGVGDDRLVIYKGDQIPKEEKTTLIYDEIQGVFYNDTYIGLVFLDTTGTNQYRLDVYDASCNMVMSHGFDVDYKDIFFYKNTVTVYNDTDCLILNMQGIEKYNGKFENPVVLLSALSNSRYMAVTKESIDIIEMK